MNLCPPRSACALALTAVLATFSQGQDTPKPKKSPDRVKLEKNAEALAAQLAQAKEKLPAAENRARESFVKRFEAVQKQVRTVGGLAAEQRIAKMKKLGEEKEAFAADGKLPE